ncbi:MAG: ferritin-like domain-containing protein [bacterium]|nr:ferritin-like domain-containing protein [bacterium]
MEIQEFARNVLLGDSLEAKLSVPSGFTDEGPEHSLVLPAFPAREETICFDRQSRGPAFPSRDALQGASERGIAMHVFAHHELMALELMALALLKLTDAPMEFRLGIARTMLEEQDHFRAYRTRAEALGVGFGELPLSGFFWNALHGIASPIDYVTQISMTFEQANLDFAEFYAARFDEVGDDACARVMRKVYDDEVGHVAYGLEWFERMRSDRGSTWEAYRRALPSRLSPSWAKGIGFCERGRRAAGLDEEFIREVRLFSRSKGRPPRVYISNPQLEHLPSLAGEAYATPGELAQVGVDLAPSLVFHANRSDIVVCERPDLGWLERLRRLEVGLPEFVAPEALASDLLARGHVWSLDPCCESAKTRRLREQVGDRLMHHPAVGADAIEPWRQALVERVEAEEAQTAVPADSDSSRGSVSTVLRMSVSGHTERKRGAHSIVRRIANSAGGFGGYLLERPLAGLDADLVRGLHRAAGHPPMFARLQGYAQSAHEDLRALGYRGAFVLHFLLRTGPGGEVRAELSELQTGVHMDATAAALAKIVHRKRVGLWLHIETERMRTAGFESSAALMAHLDKVLPVETAKTPGTIRLKRGALPTCSPLRAVHRFTVLLVAESLEAVAASLPGDLARIGS